MADLAIEAKGLTKHYGETVAVDGIDLAVPRGEVFGLLGPNGAGKTTTILMLLGLTEPTSGRVRVAGLDPAREALAVRSTVGYLPDAVGFYETMTGAENLSYTARLNRLPRTEARGRVDELLDLVGLADAKDDRVGTYSRGMRQRLGIADALVKSPTVVVLDEPTASIDPEGTFQIQRLIRSLADDQNMTVLVSSHLLHQMQLVCDRVAIFVAGRIVDQGSPRQLAAGISEGRVTLELESDSDEETLRRALDPLGSSQLTSTGLHHWRFTTPADRGSAVVPALAAAGVGVLQLRRLDDDLDEVYRRHFESEVAR